MAQNFCYSICMAKRWTPEEKQILINNRNAGIPYSEIPLDRPISSMKTIAANLMKEGLITNPHEHYKSWTEAEDLQLIQLRNENTPYKEIERILGRGPNSVRKRATILSNKGMLRLKDHPTSTFNRKPEVAKRVWKDEELLDLVRKYRTQDNLNYNREIDEPSSGPIIKRFGTWTAAVEAAGILRNLGVFDPDKLTIVYLVKFEQYYKLGLTQRTVAERLKGFPPYTIIKQIELNFDEAWKLERKLLRYIEPYKIVGNLPNGNTECFIAPNLSEFFQCWP